MAFLKRLNRFRLSAIGDPDASRAAQQWKLSMSADPFAADDSLANGERTMIYRARSVGKSICLVSLDGRSVLLPVNPTSGEELSEEDMRLKVEMRDWLSAVEWIEAASDDQVTALLDPEPSSSTTAPSSTIADSAITDVAYLPSPSSTQRPSKRSPGASTRSSDTSLVVLNTYRRSPDLPAAASDVVRGEVLRMSPRRSFWRRGRRRSSATAAGAQEGGGRMDPRWRASNDLDHDEPEDEEHVYDTLGLRPVKPPLSPGSSKNRFSTFKRIVSSHPSS